MGHDSDDAVRATRADLLNRVSGWLRGALQTMGRLDRSSPPVEMRSMLVAASHHDGAIHMEFVLSTRDEPRWPHTCQPPGEPIEELCSACAYHGEIHWGWNALIPAFQPWCVDGPYAWSENFRPILVAHVETGAAYVGHQVRPWLDLPRTLAAPRAVSDRVRRLLATYREDPAALVAVGDALVEAGDPRGDLIAGARELEASAGRSWLGSFDQLVPRGELRFDGGVPVEIGLFLPDDHPELMPVIPSYRPWRRDDELPWLLGPRVRFLPNSARKVWPALAPVRALGPLDGEALIEMAHAKTSFAVEELEAELATWSTLAHLFAAAAHAPRLRVVRLVGPHATAHAIPQLRAWPRLAQLARIEIAQPFESVEAHLAEAGDWRDFPIPVHISQYDEATARASGWCIELPSLRVVRIGYLSEATEAYAARLRAT